MAFQIGAFCLFKGRYDFIHELWEYKQPHDADATYIGDDILPTTVEELTNQYFRRAEHQRDPGFWEDHHGATLYFNQYFIIFLAKTLRTGGGDVETKARAVNFRNFDINRLSDVEHSTDKLVTIAREMKANVVWGELAFDDTNIDDLIEQGVVPFLQLLKESATLQISERKISTPLSQKKIETFKSRFLEGFYKTASIRSVLTDLGCFVDRSEENYLLETKSFGISKLENRAAFFDEWNVSFVDWGEGFGRNFGGDENKAIFNLLTENTTELSIDAIGRPLTKLIRQLIGS